MKRLFLSPWPIIALFCVLGVIYSVAVPIFEASDELWHYPMVEHLARAWTLPVQPLEPGATSGPWRQEASQPPLYYALSAALTAWIDTSDMEQVRHLNPHVAAGEVTPDGSNVNLVVHNPALERFPWKGTVLAVHLVRLFSVALGAWAVYLTWALVRELYPDPPWLALAAAATHAFTPMYLFISASVNNDNLIVPLCSWALLIMVRRVKNQRISRSADQRISGSADQRVLSPQSSVLSPQPSALSPQPSVLSPQSSVLSPQSSVPAYLLLGVVIGLGLLTKASAIGLLPLAAATIAWETWQENKAAKKRKSEKASQQFTFHVSRFTFHVSCNLALTLLPALAISGWWFVRNFRLYGDWLGLNAFYAVLGTRNVPADLAQLWAERHAFAAGYWGNFGGLNVLMRNSTYTFLNFAAAIAAVGLVVRFGLWVLRDESKVKGQKSKVGGSANQRIGESTDQPSVLSPQPSALSLQPSAFSPQPSALSPQPSALSPQSSVLSPQSLKKLWPFAWDAMTAARALAWAWPAAVFVSWIRWATITWSSQGRLIFSAIPMWSLALVMGLQMANGEWRMANSEWRMANGEKTDRRSGGSANPPRYLAPPLPRSPSPLLPLLLLFLCLLALPAWIAPAYRPPRAARAALTTSPLRADFGNVLRLTGFTVDRRNTYPGETVGLTLQWEALTPTAADHSLFIHVLGEGERIIAQRDTFPGRGLVSTTWLEPGRAWIEHYEIAIPPLAYAPDNLTFAVGMVETATGARLPVQANAPLARVAAGDAVTFGDVWLTEAQEPLDVRFGKGMALTSYALDALSVTPGDALSVTLHWRCAAPIDGDYTISIQLIDDQWRKAAQSDAWPLDGAAPTSSWQKGQTLAETRALPIAADALPGVYDLRLAVYRANENGDLDHLPIVWQPGQMPAKSVLLTRVRVK